jgi:general L-amino acid transport system permease protein
LGRNPLNDSRIRGWFWQALLLSALLSGLLYLANNAIQNLTARNIPIGFAFLWQTAGFDIEQTLVPWDSSDPYGRAILVGLANTLVAAALSIVCATLLGLLIGLMRLSSNPLFRGTAGAFIGLMRNIPQLLLVVFWYFVVLRSLPAPRRSVNVADAVFLNVRGLYVPAPVFDVSAPELTGAFAAILALSVPAYLVFRRRFPLGHRTTAVLFASVFGILVTVCAASAYGTWITFDYPRLSGFNFVGGLHLFPEFVALVAALSMAESAFIAEIIRAGVLSVDRGQIEAARALGLSRRQMIRLVVLPQALRVIIPPLTSDYLSLTKATSLGVAIAYPDLVQVFAGIVLSRTGQEIEVMFITMMIYLCISLITSALMNWYNNRTRIIGR